MTRLLTYTADGRTTFGVIGTDGRIVDLGARMTDVHDLGDLITRGRLADARVFERERAAKAKAEAAENKKEEIDGYTPGTPYMPPPVNKPSVPDTDDDDYVDDFPEEDDDV